MYPSITVIFDESNEEMDAIGTILLIIATLIIGLATAYGRYNAVYFGLAVLFAEVGYEIWPKDK